MKKTTKEKTVNRKTKHITEFSICTNQYDTETTPVIRNYDQPSLKRHECKTQKQTFK